MSAPSSSPDNNNGDEGNHDDDDADLDVQTRDSIQRLELLSREISSIQQPSSATRISKKEKVVILKRVEQDTTEETAKLQKELEQLQQVARDIGKERLLLQQTRDSEQQKRQQEEESQARFVTETRKRQQEKLEEVQREGQTRIEEEQSRQQEIKDKIETKTLEYQKELEIVYQQHEEQLELAKKEHQDSISELRRQHDEIVQEIQDRTASENLKHQRQLEQVKKDHQDCIAQLHHQQREIKQELHNLIAFEKRRCDKQLENVKREHQDQMAHLQSQQEEIEDKITDERQKHQIRLERIAAMDQWIDSFEEQQGGRVLIHSPVKRCSVWLIGDSGHGKTTTVQQLQGISEARNLVNGRVLPDLERIEVHELNFIQNRKLYNAVLMDTLGTCENGSNAQYDAADLYWDMCSHCSTWEENKVVYVVRYWEHQPGQDQISRISDVIAKFGSNFLILITHCSKDSAPQELRETLSSNEVSFSGEIQCIDWPEQGRTLVANEHLDAFRWQILTTILQLPSVDVRSLNPRGKVMAVLEKIERECFKNLGLPRAMDYLTPAAILSSMYVGPRLAQSAFVRFVGILTAGNMVTRQWYNRSKAKT